ncbi:MAG: phosphatase PAP2 family protein [Acetobacteraceae bacterium]
MPSIIATPPLTRRIARLGLGFALAALFAGCTPPAPQPEPPAPVAEIRPGILPGYLAAEALPNSQALLPPPPDTSSATFVRDKAFSQRSLPLRDTARWTLAEKDADLYFPAAAGTFACALGVPVSEAETPRLYVLLRRTVSDALGATRAAKSQYKRPRPFMMNGKPICTPSWEEDLRKDGSYPSGHASTGWAWALILAELAPDRQDAVLARGRAFGQSRIVCNVHWQSDVLAGQAIGASTVARLHADPVFQADLAAARRELNAARAKQTPPARDCAAEAAALALDPQQAP